MRIFTFLLLLPLLLSSGCALAAPTDTRPVTSEEDASIMRITGKVVFIPLEGGFYGIVGDDGRQFDPLNLPEEFQSDGLLVRATLRHVEGVVSFRMWGTIVEIVKIEKCTKPMQ